MVDNAAPGLVVPRRELVVQKCPNALERSAGLDRLDG